MALVSALAAVALPAGAVELLQNGDFEDGTLAPWFAPEPGNPSGLCEAGWNVSDEGGYAATGCQPGTYGGNYPGAPYGGSWSAYNAFDGPSPLEYALVQEIRIPYQFESASLSWADTYNVDLTEGHATLPRSFRIELRSPGIGAAGAVLHEREIGTVGQQVESDWTVHQHDVTEALRPFAGRVVQIALVNAVPESRTGPAGFGLDDASLQVESDEIFRDGFEPVPGCGDGKVDEFEQCDDGNRSDGDGCSRSCGVEFGWQCQAQPLVPSSCNLVGALSSVTLGAYGGCVIATDGALGCFGINDHGSVGSGTAAETVFLPEAVPGIGPTKQVAIGDAHRCALDLLGEVRCWGDNQYAQLGPNGQLLASSPLPVAVPLPVIESLVAGEEHTCALDDDGRVWCWGSNEYLQTGFEGQGLQRSPWQVALPGNQAAIALGVGDTHSCAVLEDGTVACWGNDEWGQLGDGQSGLFRATAEPVTGLAGVVEVHGGGESTCARTGAGDVYCWGINFLGQLGNGSFTLSPIPVQVLLAGPARRLAVGEDQACAVLEDDSVYCWGGGYAFALGNGDVFDASVPVQVTELPPGPWHGLSVGYDNACVVSDQGERWCWGYSAEGELGLAPRSQIDPFPTLFSSDIVGLVAQPSFYDGVLCALREDGQVECAGNGTPAPGFDGAGGFFGGPHYHRPVPVVLPHIAGVSRLALGQRFACALADDQGQGEELRCWGDNGRGQLGQGTVSEPELQPLPVAGLGAVDELAAGTSHACVREGGQVSCWGNNIAGQTGGPVLGAQGTPTVVAGLADATQLALGSSHSCALRSTGAIACWGNDQNGQLGDGSGDSSSATPVEVVGLPAASQVVAGERHNCALASGTVYCWGSAQWGNLGQGNQDNEPAPVAVPGLPEIVRLSSGYNYTCALDVDGSLWCWGYSLDGHLGDGGLDLTGREFQPSPIRFPHQQPIEDMVTGNSVACIKSAGEWSCLGLRGAGQLANGTILEPAVPHPALFGL